MSLKVFEIAKKLGIDSKVILQKCKDEGLPPPTPPSGKDKPWSHMSPVGAGLAATIEEWFSSGELKTAIESTMHVEAAKIQKAPRKRTSKKAAGSGSGGSSQDSATALAELPEETGGAALESEESAENEPEESAERAAPVVVAEAPVEEATAPVAEVAEHPPAVEPERAALVTETPVAPVAQVAPVAPAAPVLHEVPVKPVAPVAAPKAAVAAPVKPAAPQIPQKPVRPAVMPAGKVNVPTRPTNVAPAGPQVKPAAATVQGPKFVRMEQPDQLPAPRPRPRPMGQGMGRALGKAVVRVSQVQPERRPIGIPVRGQCLRCPAQRRAGHAVPAAAIVRRL